MEALRKFFEAQDNQQKNTDRDAYFIMIQRRDDLRMIYEEVKNEQ